MSKDAKDFDQFMKTREEAAQGFGDGDASRLGHLVTRESPATFFGPRGGHTRGAGEVWSTYDHDARTFEPGGETHFETFHKGASEGIGYWVGLQHARVRMHGHAEAIPMTLRVTEVFRREGSEWKLVHRHADSMASESKEPGKPGPRGGKGQPRER